MRQQVPVIITFVVGLIYTAANFLNVPGFSDIKSTLDKWFLVATGFTVAVGLINIAMIHLNKVSRKSSDYKYSYALLIAMAITTVGTIADKQGGPFFQFIFDAFIIPLSGAMYAVLTFYMASGAYRAFRARSVEATVLLITGVIVMLGMAPIGSVLWSKLPVICDWIIAVPNTAGMRGIGIGATLGAVATALRTLLGIERSHLGSS